ncbi:CHAT domain-containing protein [Actinocorallia aurantiaca]|uniref:CHAT domain-containing protein n=1 Tax=Actinocorallia aurantiaca TaxID=46204 RepID=A0ABP6GYJ3_9ACTN
MYSDRIRDFSQSYSPADLITRFDAHFDVPLRHEYAIGLLRMQGAFAAEAPAAERVGAHWCDIVRSDVEYALLDGLRLIELSRGDAERLLAGCRDGTVPHDDEFSPYAAARWQDGAGRIHYRLGNFAQARIHFETAERLASDRGLWWCLPDIRGNLYRADLEERRQTAAPEVVQERLDAMLDQWRRTLDDAEALHDPEEILRRAGSDEATAREREFLRGLSNLRHNVAVGEKEKGRAEESERASLASSRISETLGDWYRIGQALNHRAQLDPSRAPGLYRQLLDGKWRRGRQMARQHLARLKGGVQGASELHDLLRELAEGAADGRSAGMDIEIHAYTVRLFASLVGALDPARAEAEGWSDRYAALAAEVPVQRQAMADSIRRVVALPAYKRAYASAVRPNYLERVARLLDGKDEPGLRPPERLEEALGLTEESSARELLDLMSASALPFLDSPPPPLPGTVPLPSGPVRGGGSRRVALRESGGGAEFVEAMERRQREFEEQFLRRPLETAPHDPEIAHRMRMYTVNHPDTCIVRYFAHGPAGAVRIGAFVVRGGRLGCVPDLCGMDGLRALAEGLPVERAPSRPECERIWELLVAPLWGDITADELPGHLVMIPTDDVFTVPLHLAVPPGDAGMGTPLGARVPLSHSVSATAFVTRGRHLLKRQPVEPDDDLAAVIVARDGVSGREVVGTGWPAGRTLIVGDMPDGLEPEVRRLDPDWRALAAVSAVKPEFFVYAGHGTYDRSYGQTGPSLEFGGDRLTQYDLALRLRLPRNKLTVLGACLAGQGEQTGGGDVVGFLRSLTASGAGAVGVPLWSVRDQAIADTVRVLLRASRTALDAGGAGFDVVETLHAEYREIARRPLDFASMVEFMPISLYL